MRLSSKVHGTSDKGEDTAANEHAVGDVEDHARIERGELGDAIEYVTERDEHEYAAVPPVGFVVPWDGFALWVKLGVDVLIRSYSWVV